MATTITGDAVNTPATNTNSLSTTSSTTTELAVLGGLKLSALQVLQFQHKLPGGDNSGACTGGTWNLNRPFNYVKKNTIPGASVDTTAKTFTLPAGTYWMYLYAGSFYTNSNMLRLFNITDNVVVDYGVQGHSYPAAGYNNTGSIFQGFVTITATKTFRLDHWTESSVSTYAWGYRPAPAGAAIAVDAIYSDFIIWRVSY